ncbi:MAG: copper resistance protein CopC [Nitrospirota bacterium]|jgi:methionine-rich copper-binding protein CopC
MISLRVARWAAAVLFPLVLLCVLPVLSLGHVFPDHSEPKVGEEVLDPPTHVRIWFDGAMEPLFSSIVVKDMSGNQVDNGDGHVASSDPTLLEASLPPLPAGAYRVFWNVVARDGHRTIGDYTFVIK